MFHGWDNFYLLIGTAAATLIGLLFVVATLTRGLESPHSARGTRLYTTPTVFHFAAVLVMSVVALTPELSRQAGGPMIAICGAIGFVYAAAIALQLRAPVGPDPPHWSDFWWYGFAPVIIYPVIGAAAALVWAAIPSGAYAVGFALLTLLVVGIRNAWDLVTWLAPRGAKG
jgi:hypothetical protein